MTLRWDSSLIRWISSRHDKKRRTFSKRIPVPLFQEKMCEPTDLVVKIWWWPLGDIHLSTSTHKDLKLRNQNLPDIRMYDEILYRHVSWKIRDPDFWLTGHSLSIPIEIWFFLYFLPHSHHQSKLEHVAAKMFARYMEAAKIGDSPPSRCQGFGEKVLGLII